MQSLVELNIIEMHGTGVMMFQFSFAPVMRSVWQRVDNAGFARHVSGRVP